MKKTLIYTVMVVALVSWCGMVFAAGRGGGGGISMSRGHWWTNSEIVKELNLSNSQVEKIEKISRDSRRDVVPIRSQMELVEIDLEDVLSKSKVDVGKAKSLINKIVDLRSQMGAKRMASLLEIRQVLTKSQYLKLKTQIKQHRSKGMGGRRPEGQRRLKEQNR